MGAKPSFLWVVGITDAQKGDPRFNLSVQAALLEPNLRAALPLVHRSTVIRRALQC